MQLFKARLRNRRAPRIPSRFLRPLGHWSALNQYNLHLTIRFLGHVDRSLAEGIAERVVLAAPKGFDVELGALGMFKRGKLAREPE